VDPDLLPRARDVAALGAGMLARGESVPAEEALPVYVRENVAKKPGLGKSGNNRGEF
jgi:tRNA threonylcarbamoyladenosine biosynthesis protein TsaB